MTKEQIITFQERSDNFTYDKIKVKNILNTILVHMYDREKIVSKEIKTLTAMLVLLNKDNLIDNNTNECYNGFLIPDSMSEYVHYNDKLVKTNKSLDAVLKAYEYRINALKMDIEFIEKSFELIEKIKTTTDVNNKIKLCEELKHNVNRWTIFE